MLVGSVWVAMLTVVQVALSVEYGIHCCGGFDRTSFSITLISLRKDS